MFRVLSLDPGTQNFGWSCSVFESKARMRVIRCGMLRTLIKILVGKEVQSDALAYRKGIDYLIHKSRADHIAAERYLPRRQGLANESINMMLGYMICSQAHLPATLTLTLAATWKLKFKKLMDIEAFYRQCRPVPDHVVDSVLIAIYAADREGRFKSSKLGSRHFLKQLEKQIKSAYR